MKREKKVLEEETMKELARYKDLMGLREKEIDTFKNELRRIQKSNDDMKYHIDYLEKENKGQQ